jgi:hypothetical protein
MRGQTADDVGTLECGEGPEVLAIEKPVEIAIAQVLAAVLEDPRNRRKQRPCRFAVAGFQPLYAYLAHPSLSRRLRAAAIRCLARPPSAPSPR